jgi:hypothetical protein
MVSTHSYHDKYGDSDSWRGRGMSAENKVGEEDPFLLKNQVRHHLSRLRKENAYLNANKLTDFSDLLVKRAIHCFGEDQINKNIPAFGREYVHDPINPILRFDAVSRIQALIDSMSALLSYLEYELGDPMALELFSNTMSQAESALERDMTVCSVLLCRITLEQSLRRLCERLGMVTSPDERAASLAQKLRKPEGILELHKWKELDAKLTLANKIIHNEEKATKEMAKDLIDWTNRFIDHYLEGK